MAARGRQRRRSYLPQFETADVRKGREAADRLLFKHEWAKAGVDPPTSTV